MLILELRSQLDYYNQLNKWIQEQEEKLEYLNKDNELMALLQSVPGIGPMTASCCLSAVVILETLRMVVASQRG